ncbi:hypothetical protein [Streptococcus ferus]|uniref:hypothetical protein n=1 Tax=Streptococcus ferus TaxID=1345 RepID=UPI0035A0B466
MKLKKYFLILTGIVCFITFLGGCNLVNREKNTSDEQQKIVEVELSKKIISEYEGVKTIRFNKWGHSKETGMWYITAKINSDEEISFSLSEISADSIKSEVMGDDFSLKERSKKIDIDNISLKDYNIIYSTN